LKWPSSSPSPDAGESEQQIAEYLSLLKALPIRVKAQKLWSNVDLESLARRRNLAAYDAASIPAVDRRPARLAVKPVAAAAEARRMAWRCE